MTDWPESVREYEKATQYISREPAYDPGMVADIADAAIRDLKAMYEYEYGTFVPKELYEAQAQRAEKAEAAHAACSEKLRASNAICIAEKRRTEQAENRLMLAEGARDSWQERAEQAEADLQTIKALLDEVEQREARRCGTCALWQEWKPGSWDCAEEWCGYSANPETFGCTHWEQRREG